MKSLTPPPVISLNNTSLLDLHSAFAVKLLIAALVLLLLPAGPAFAATFNVANDNQLRAAWSAINSNGEPDILNITASFEVFIELEFTDRDPNTLTINGNGHTLRLSRNYEPFSPYSGRTLYLNNIIISGGSPSQTINPANRAAYVNGTLIADRLTVLYMQDSAIRVSEGAKLTVTNSLFRDNTSTAIAFDGGAEVDIRNSRFINNTASQASAIKGISSVQGNQITTHGNYKLYNNIFRGNQDLEAQESCFPLTNICTPYLDTDFNFGQGAVVIVGGVYTPQNNHLRYDVPGTFLDMRGNTITGNSHDCFVSDFVTITPQSYGANTIGPKSNPTCLLLHRPPDDDRPRVKKTEPAPYKPTVSTCTTLAGISAFNISESTQCQRVNAMQIANPAFPAGSFADAMDVWGWVTPNSEICFEASGSAIKFIDTAAMPRTTSDLIAFRRQNTVCASIDGPGILVLLPGDAPAAGSGQAGTASSASRKLSDCMVRLTEKLNFRAAPAGEIMEVLSKDFKLTAEERTDAWFKVDFWGKKGWISADYVVTEGACG